MVHGANSLSDASSSYTHYGNSLYSIHTLSGCALLMSLQLQKTEGIKVEKYTQPKRCSNFNQRVKCKCTCMDLGGGAGPRINLKISYSGAVQKS